MMAPAMSLPFGGGVTLGQTSFLQSAQIGAQQTMAPAVGYTSPPQYAQPVYAQQAMVEYVQQPQQQVVETVAAAPQYTYAQQAPAYESMVVQPQYEMVQAPQYAATQPVYAQQAMVEYVQQPQQQFVETVAAAPQYTYVEQPTVSYATQPAAVDMFAQPQLSPRVMGASYAPQPAGSIYMPNATSVLQPASSMVAYPGYGATQQQAVVAAPTEAVATRKKKKAVKKAKKGCC